MRRLAIPILLVVALAAAVVVAWLAGVFGPGGGGPDAPVVLRVANWGGPAVDPSFMKVEREIREGFERRHGVRLQVENIPGAGQYVPKLLMMFVAENPPDVMHLDASSAAVFIDNGLLTDLVPFIEKDPGFDLGAYFPNVVDIARRGNRLFAVPGDFTPMAIVYNKRLFDKAGVPYPKSGWGWDEFLKAAKALTVFEPGEAAPSQYGFRFENWMPGWLPWIWAAGGDVLSPDGKRALGYFDSPETLAAIQFVADMVRKDRVAPNLSETAVSGVDLFRAGRAAMTLTGHWSLIEYRVDRMDVGVVGIPTRTGRRVTVMYEAGLAISRTSPHKDLAWEYVKYMTSAEAQKPVLALGVAISANREVARSFAGTEVEDAFLDEVPYARPPWGSRVERYELVEDLGREMMEDVLTGGVPVEEAVRRAASLVDADLRRR